MDSKPILFSGAMVRAILEGRKTQTRRLHIKSSMRGKDFHYLTDDLGYSASRGHLWAGFGQKDDPVFVKVPYTVGMALWVRETWARCGCDSDCQHPGCHTIYKADERRALGAYGAVKWRPSIHMPRWASRLTLEVTAVRVQRLQQISEEDAVAEGCDPFFWQKQGDSETFDSAIECFELLWDSLNAKRGYPWKDNPWIVTYTFKILEAK